MLVWAALIVLLYVGTTWFQGYIYNEPAEGLLWRAPAAGSALALFLALWCYLYHKSADGNFERIFAFAPRKTVDFPVPRDANQPAQFWAVNGNQKTLFEKKRSQGGTDYRDAA